MLAAQVTDSWHRIADAICGRWAISWFGAAALAAVHICALFIQAIHRHVPLANAAAGSAAVTLLVFAGAGVLDRTALRDRRRHRLRVRDVAAAYLILGACLNLLQNLLLHQLGYPASFAYIAIALTGAAEAATILTLAATLLSSLDFQNLAQASLRAEQAALTAQRLESSRVLVDAQYRLARLVDDEVTAAVREVSDELGALAEQPSRAGMATAAARLRGIAEASARGLSHQLARDEPGSPLSQQVSANLALGELHSPDFDADHVNEPGTTRASDDASTGASFAATLRDALRAPLNVALFTVLVAALSIPVFLESQGLASGVLSTVQFLAVTVGAISAVNWLMRRDWYRDDLPWLNAAVQVAGLLISALSLPVIVVRATSTDAHPLGSLIASALVISIGLGCLLIAALISQQQRALSDVRAMVSLERWELSQVDSDIQRTRARIAQVLHSGVQGDLIAAAMALTLAQPDTAGAAIAQAQSIVAQVLRELDRPARTDALNGQTMSEALAAVTEPWRRVMPVEVTLTREDAARLDANRLVAAEVLSLAREALSNAARHGRARHAAVAIEVRAESVHITVVNDGDAPPAVVRAGFGLSQIGNGATWQLKATVPNGAELTVVIPVSL